MDNQSNSSSILNIDVVNKNWEQIKVQQAFQKYSDQFQIYIHLCYENYFKFLDNSNIVKDTTVSAYNCQRAIEQINFIYSIFSNPNLFALNKDQDIYCIKYIDFSFNRTNYKDIFFKFNYFHPPLEFIDSLYEVVSLRKKNEHYWKYIHYRYQNHCESCIFDRFEFFRTIDGNILFDENAFLVENVAMIRSSINTLLHENDYKKPVNVNNHYAAQENSIFSKIKQPTFRQFKAIIDILKNSKIEIEAIKKHDEQILLQLILWHLQQNHDLAKLVLTGSHTLEPLTWLEGKPKHILEERRNFLSINKKPPINFIRQLSILTDGSVAALNQLAMLLARINLVKNHKKETFSSVPSKITIILTSNVKMVQKFFDQLYPEGRKNYKSIHDVCNRKNLIEHILFKMAGGILQVCEHGKSVSSEDLKIIKKFVRMMPVHKQDKAVGKLTYISNSHYVVLVKKQEEVMAYKNHFQNLSEVIVLNGEKDGDDTLLDQKGTVCSSQRSSTAQRLILPILEEFDYKWVHTIFATHGLLLLAEENVSLSIKQPLLDLQGVVLSFLTVCCTLEPTVDCYADELYLLYRGYVVKKYGVEPIKKIRFVNILKLDGQYSYLRLRHHAKDNRWGFKGIGIKKEKWEEYVTLNIESPKNQKENQIFAYLGKINRTICPLIGIE